MRAGELNELITVQNIEITKDQYGSEGKNWKDFYTNVRATVTHNSGNRNVSNNEVVFNYNVLFTIRLFYNIDEKMRILHDGKKYRITSIVKSKKTQSITIITELINE